MANGDFGRLEFLRRLGRVPSQAQMVQQPSMGPVRVPPSIVRQPSTPALSPSMQRLADLNAARYVAGVPSPYRMPSPAAQPAVAGGPQLPPPPTQMARPAGLTPMDRAGLAAGIAGLQYAGPQAQPTSFAQGLGVMAQAGLEAFDAAKAAEAERKMAEIELGLKAREVAVAEAKAGGPFSGTSMKAQSFNTLVNLAPKIKDGTATEQEKQIYALAHSDVSQDREVRSFDERGNERIETIPGQNLSAAGFPPPFAVEGQVTTKPTPETIKRGKQASDLEQMAARLNAYRNILMSEDFDRMDITSGVTGFPSDDMAKASSAAELLRMDLKKLYELGALVGGDFQILDNLLTSPNSSKALKAGKQSLLIQLDQLEETLASELKEVDVKLSGTYLTPVEIKSPEDWAALPVGSYGKTPDGSIKYKAQ